MRVLTEYGDRPGEVLPVGPADPPVRHTGGLGDLLDHERWQVSGACQLRASLGGVERVGVVVDGEPAVGVFGVLERFGHRTHRLKGDMAGHYSIWVNGNWRITFRFIESDVELVDYQDCH